MSNNNNDKIIDLVSIATNNDDYNVVIDAINTIIELKYVLVHPDTHAGHALSGSQRYRWAHPDICVPYCPATSSIQSVENYIQYNQEELANLLTYLHNSMNTYDDHSCSPLDELYNYRFTQLTSNDKLVLRDDCIPRHTSIAFYDNNTKRGILSEVADITVCVPFNKTHVVFLERGDNKVDIVRIPRWRALEVQCHQESFENGLSWNDMWHPNLNEPQYCHGFIERWVNYDMQSFFIPLPDGVAQHEFLNDCPSIDYLGTTFHNTSYGYICQLDLVPHPSQPEAWIRAEDVITHDGHSFTSIRDLSRTLGVERTNIRTYHSIHDLKIKRNRHYPQSNASKLLNKFTIGFEVEKTNPSYISACEQTITLPLFAGWEYDGSCGIEGITHAYTMDNLAGFITDANASTFMTNLPLSTACGGHINIMDNNVQRNNVHKYPTERYLGRKSLRPLVGVVYAHWRDRLKNGYCRGDVRILEESPDRYSAIRNKRNRMTELRISAAFATHDDLINAFAFMQTIVKCATVAKFVTIARISGITDVADRLVSQPEYDYAIEQLTSKRLKRAAEPDVLTDYYHKHKIPAYHANYNGLGIASPDSRPLHYDWIYYVIDSLSPWFKANGYDHKRIVEFTRDAYALQHYVEHCNTSKTCEHARKYLYN